MKLLIASDIHGSAHYCAQLMAQIEAENPDQVLLLGDLLYHGPRNALPEEYDCPKAYDMLNGIKERIVAVRGNCDSEVDQMVLEFPIMADYALLEADGVVLYATHGHLWNEMYLPPMREGTVLLNGHTHVPACTPHGSYVYMNPGSVSIPKGGSRHSYMTLENGVFQWKDLEGTVYQEYHAQQAGPSRP